MPKDELATKQPPETSHILRMYLGEKVLLVFMGVQHRSELLQEPPGRTSHRINAMREEWDDFNYQTTDAPLSRLAIHEGPPRIVLPNETELETYQRGGEPTLLTRWAKEGDRNSHGVEAISGEPPLGSEVSHLLQSGHPPDAILLHYYIREYLSWASRQPRPDPIDYAHTLAERYESFLSDYPAFERFDFSLKNIGAIHREYYNWDEWRFDPGASDFLEQTMDVKFASTLAIARNCYGDSVIQRIAYDCQVARDYHLITLFERQLKLGRKIFSIFGWPHAYAITPAIEHLQEQVNSTDSWMSQSTPLRTDKMVPKPPERHRLEHVLNWDNYTWSEARDIDEIVGDQPNKTVLLDYDFLASLYGKAQDEKVLADEQRLYQQAAEQLHRYNFNASRLEDSFGPHCHNFVGSIQKVRINQVAIEKLNKHTRYQLHLDGVEHILPAVRIERFFSPEPSPENAFGLTVSVADIENQTMTVDQYVEACMRWICYDTNWLPFNAQLFTAVHNSPDIMQIVRRLDDPKFCNALRQFLHQTVDYYEKTGEMLKLDEGNVVFSKTPTGEYTYRVRNDFGQKDYNPHTVARRFNNSLVTSGSYQDRAIHRQFLARCNYIRTLQGLLAATDSPLYRNRTTPPFWQEMPDKVTRFDWLNVYQTTKRLFHMG